MKSEPIKAFMNQWINENYQAFYDLADYIWEHPELGLEEYQSSLAIQTLLKEHGFEVTSGQGGMPTAFVATFGSGKTTAGINVEFDALPALSQRMDVSSCTPIIEGGPGHGCGHNILGTGAVFASVVLRYAIEVYGLDLSIKLIGAPYEEASVGKPLLVRAGVCDGVDFIIDWHPSWLNLASYDKCNSVFVLQIQFHGRKGHGMRPWNGRSALDAAMLFGHAIEILREHLIPNVPSSPNTINYTFIDCGSRFANVIPDRTTVELYGRFHDMPTSRDAFERVKLCAEGAALATQTTVDFKIVTYTHNRISNQTLSRIVHNNLRAYGAPVFTEEEQTFVKNMQREFGIEPIGLDTDIAPFGPAEVGISDISEYSWNVPFVTFRVVMGPSGGWHNWMVTACAGNSIGKKALMTGVRIMSSSGIDIISDPSIIPRAKEELKERLGGETYECLLPADHAAPLGVNYDEMQKYRRK